MLDDPDRGAVRARFERRLRLRGRGVHSRRRIDGGGAAKPSRGGDRALFDWRRRIGRASLDGRCGCAGRGPLRHWFCEGRGGFLVARLCRCARLIQSSRRCGGRRYCAPGLFAMRPVSPVSHGLLPGVVALRFPAGDGLSERCDNSRAAPRAMMRRGAGAWGGGHRHPPSTVSDGFSPPYPFELSRHVPP